MDRPDGRDRDPGHAPSFAEAQAVARRAEVARSAGRRMVARGERPLYRYELLRTMPEVELRIVELPWLTTRAPSMRGVTAAAARLVSDWLGVDPDRLDVESAR
jgi:hypothetical protein